MQPRVFLLVVSVALNAALLAAFVLRPTLAPPAVREFFQRGSVKKKPAASVRRDSPAEAALRATIAAQRAADRQAQIWPTLKTDDLSALVARLRAAGFSAAVVRAIVDAQIEARFSGRIKALTRANEETPYWKPDPHYDSGNSKIFEELGQIYRERARALREVLGKDAMAWGGVDLNAAQRQRFGDLPQGKIDLIQRINDDYAEMTSPIRAAMQGITLPEDRQKLALLEREKRTDLAEILTPIELADYEMRTSSTTMRLRGAFSIMDVTEQEFRTIYGIHQPFAEQLHPSMTGVYTAEMSGQRREATRQVNEQLKATLGEARFAQFLQASQSEFQQLYRVAQRDNLSFDTVSRAFAVRDTTAGASTQIMSNQALSTEQKRTQLQQLALNARIQILSTLGPNVGPTYAQGANWLSFIEQGGSISITTEGGLSYHSLPSSTPPKR